MTDGENDIELLDRYLQGALAHEERLTLEIRLLEEEELRKLLADLKVLQAGIQLNARADLKKELQFLEGTIGQSVVPAQTVPLRVWIIGMAAAVAIIVSSILVWPKQGNPQELYAEYFEPYPNIIMPTVRGPQEPDTSLLAKAYHAYDNKNYQQAIAYFETSTKKNDDILLYLGNSYLVTNQYEKAIATLKLTTKASTFGQQRDWYLALALLHEGKTDEAIPLLESVQKKNNLLAAKAATIIKRLKH